MNLTREQMLVEMGITPLWELRHPVPLLADDFHAAAAAAPGEEAPVAASSDGGSDDRAAPPSVIRERSSSPLLSESGNAAVDRLDWPELHQCIAACRACPLGEQRRQAVPGVGDLEPDWLFVGEGPGAEEDARGEPFVGQAGKLLDAMLDALDIARGKRVYIANAVKCRPPGNRTPEASEMAACRPYLERQIALLKPKIIVLLGKVAVQAVLGQDRTLASLRGQRFDYAGIPVVVTYHPAYLLRNLPDKAKAWEDLLFARRTLRETTT